MLMRLVLVVTGVVVLTAAGVYAVFQLSPWPSVLLIRHAFEQGGADAARSTVPLAPKDVSAQRGLSYSPGDSDALFDVFAPTNARARLPAVVWVHGGGFVAGSRSDMSDYLQALAAHGYVTIAIDYTRAPNARFPIPVQQTDTALSYIVANADRLNIDPKRIFLAGDSAGAQIAAQTALIIFQLEFTRGKWQIAPGMTRTALRGSCSFVASTTPPR